VRNPGRTLVFVNSIHCIRRLLPLLQVRVCVLVNNTLAAKQIDIFIVVVVKNACLGLACSNATSCLCLVQSFVHHDLVFVCLCVVLIGIQRQRLKNLDRFRETAHCVLIATDVTSLF
jgi:hypothetical protein